ncbi:hypothetical protein F4808DRAFT_423537 [Astrocystis sublimbata]|nr:hypothetical protein F4808DRAFT_423537 [Astrocystis sublimbata]
MASLAPEPTYTVFVRLPFPRGDFVDPPPVNWESSKDEALWSIVSKLSKTEIDWNEIAAEFEVTVEFLLQQVAWLTERHASQVRAQMRKAAAAAKVSPAPSPQLPTAEPVFPADAPRYTGSAAQPQPRAPSSTSIRKDAPLPSNDQSTPSSSMRSTPRPPPTRTSSTRSTFRTARNLVNSSRGAARSSTDSQRRRLTSLPITNNLGDRDGRDDQMVNPQSPGPAESSDAASSSSSSSSSSPAQSRIIRRPPRFQSKEGPSFADDHDDGDDDAEDDDDEDAEPAFLPYRPSTDHDLSATLRGNPRDPGKRSLKGSDRHQIHHSQTSDSSSTSSAPVSRAANEKRPSGPLSPRRAMESVVRSPGGKSKGYSRDSDGTPSMGSSFSDLDDASVTQSALEEALASRMQDGGAMSSIRGTIGNVFRSRYQQPKAP